MTTEFYFIRTENPESGKRVRNLLRDEVVNIESDLSHGSVTNVLILTKNDNLLERLKLIPDISVVDDFQVELNDADEDI